VTDQVLLIITDEPELTVTIHKDADHANAAWEKSNAEHGFIIQTASGFDDVDLSVMTDIYNTFSDEPLEEPFTDHATANGRLWSLLFEKLPKGVAKGDDVTNTPTPKKAAKADKPEKPAKGQPRKSASKSNGADEKAATAKPKPAQATAPKAKAPARKAPAQKKAAAPAKPATRGGARAPTTRLYPLDAKIKLLVKENPMRAASKVGKRFDDYRDGMTVKEALATSLTTQDLQRDERKKYISIAGGAKK
jgi:hypothetical protein